MAIVNHDKLDGSKEESRKSLTRGAKVDVRETLSRTAFAREDEIGSSEVTMPANVRVDNHIRNRISSLINLGFAKSQKDFVEKLVDQVVDSLDESESKRFKEMVQIYENKDILTAKTQAEKKKNRK